MMGGTTFNLKQDAKNMQRSTKDLKMDQYRLLVSQCDKDLHI